MSRGSSPERIELRAEHPDAVVAALEGLVVEGGGWVNLFPELEEDDVARVTPSAVGLLFRAAGPPIPQATIIVPTSGRRAKPGQVGVTHGVGTRVVPRLVAEGIALPDGWTVVQDHVRRGVVVRVDGAFVPDSALDWALRAVAALCPVPLTGGWLAEVHHP